MTPMQVIFPMAGSGRRFLEAGYEQPKPLIDVGGKTVIARLLEQFPKDWRFVFVCSEEHLRTPRLKEELLASAPGCVVVGVPPHKLGPVHTLLQARELFLDDMPTLINYCDFSFSWDPKHFLDFTRRTACDGAIICYRGFHPHHLSETLYAYCREERGLVREVREKAHFTSDRTQEYASSGSYYFASGRLAKKYLAEAVRRDLKVNGEYYVSVVYNPMIEDGMNVRVYEIPHFLQWGTPEDLEDYLYWHRAFAHWPSAGKPADEGPRLLMPMAGSGTRFAGGPLPKPLIPVDGTPMFLAARGRLPCGARPVLVLRRDLEAEVQEKDPRSERVVLDEPTAGQAETARRGLRAFQPDEPVLVSACDHGILWDDTAWRRMLASGADVVVVGQRGYPGARRSPRSFSYLDAVPEGRIRRASVKTPLSAQPQRDLLLVGTFYFRSTKLLAEAIEALVARDLRVNGELYLDSVVDLCVEKGLDVRCFESRAYLNWGSPEALAEYSYWHDYFLGAAGSAPKGAAG